MDARRGDATPLERLTPFWRNLALLAIGGLLLWFAWSVRAVLNPLILGYILAFISAPAVRAIERRGLKHGTAVAVFFVSAGLVTAAVLAGFAYQGWRLAQDLVGSPRVEGEAESGLLSRIETSLEEGLEIGTDKLEEWGLLETEPVPESADGEAPRPSPTLASELTRALRGWLVSEETLGSAGEAGLKATSSFVGFLRRVLRSMVGIGTLLTLLPIYTYFLLFELDRIHAFVRRYLPRADRERFVQVGRQIGEVLANFFRGRLIVALVKGLVTAGGLAVLGVPYGLVIGLTAGFLSLVPFLGPAIAFLLSFLLGTTELELWGSLWRNALVFGAAELLEGYVLLPKILGDSLGLHEVVVLAAVMVGGAAGGMFGMLVALPVTASLVILAREFVLPPLAAWVDEVGDDGGGDPGTGSGGELSAG